jgi:hypothetical protein
MVGGIRQEDGPLFGVSSAEKERIMPKTTEQIQQEAYLRGGQADEAAA